MPARKCLLLFFILTAFLAFGDRPDANGPTAKFHVVGDIDGPGNDEVFSVVRDVTRAGDVIYAVGGSVSRFVCAKPGCLPPGADTPFLWQSDGTNVSMQALPDIDLTAATNNATGPLNGAWDITPDARYIASQARKHNPPAGFVVRAVRVTTAALPSPTANLNLNAIPASELDYITAALTISDDGTVLYANSGVNQAIRFDIASGTGPFIPLLVRNGVTDAANSVALRGASSDGSVAVGSSVNAVGNGRAYRYKHGEGVSAIPLLPGGVFNAAVAVSPDGDLVLVSGHNPAHVTVETYLWRASTGAIHQLGSPNSATTWGPGARICANGCGPRGLMGGMTPDGSVVAMTFGGADGQGAYFRNQHGWFHLASALLANGIDLAADGWEPFSIAITGMSPDATLVFGAAAQNGVVKGFIAEFPAGVLAGFNPQPAVPANTSLVGAWHAFDSSNPAAGDPDHVVVFTADGVFYQIEEEPGGARIGFERGLYTYDGSTLGITTLFDSNGTFGLSHGPLTRAVTVVGDTVVSGGEVIARRVVGSPGSLVGAWTAGNPTEARNSFVAVLTGDQIFEASDGAEEFDADMGTYTWNPVTHELTLTFRGHTEDAGLVTLAPNGLTLHAVDEGGEIFELNRVVDPASIPVITNAQLSRSGVAGEPLTYHVTATNTAAFSAAGLPAGLSINAATGEIGGVPTVGGQFAVTIKATNAIGVSDIETLTLTIAIPTPVGQQVVVEPHVPEGQGPITLTFGGITQAGTTTVTVLNLNESSVPPPGIQVGGVVYEVQTTAHYTGLITLCFSYAGVDFGAGQPRLFHYENNVWVDITTGVDPGTQTICGATTTLSPFAVLVSHVVRTGFYAPLNPLAGFLNVAQRGSTVPLKFNVYVTGVEQTTTAGLVVTVQPIACDTSAPVDDVEDVAVTGGTSLRYDPAGYFVQNWRVPRTPGACYMVRMTTEQDGLALTARFRVR